MSRLRSFGPPSALAVVLFASGCSNGTCIFDEEPRTCSVNYRQSACNEQTNTRYSKSGGDQGVAVCIREGYTVPVRTDGWRMTNQDVKAALQKGDTVTFEKPTASNTR